MTVLVLSVLFLLNFGDISAARILAVFPTPSISHQVVFRPLTVELARRGHEVTVVTADPAYPPGQAPKNLTEIDVHDLSYKLWKDEFPIQSVGSKEDIYAQVTKIFSITFKLIMSQIETKEVQDIIKTKKFDLLLLEAYTKPALVYSHFFKVPVIQVSSFGGLKFNYRTVGACTHPMLYPTQVHQKLYNLTNWDKLQQLYIHWWFENFQWKVEREQDEILKSKFGSDFPSLYELSNNVDMLFLNVNPIWVDNQPVPTNVVYMGGIHMTEPKELPQDLQSFLDSSKNGVIYFSLGTNVTPSVLPPAIIQMLVKIFSQLPYNVLWKWDKDELPGQTKNIKIFKWLPQTDLLKHPNVKLFITQGGLQSTDEAINAGVPLIGIPMLADQWYNVQKYLHFEIGVQLDFTSVTEDEFRNAILTVASDKRYRENIIRLRTLINDQPQSPLERVVWWTEHLLRHGGAKHLRAAGANISWVDYLELELVLIVLSTLIFVLIIITVFITMLWKFLMKYFRTDIKRKVS
ncbi:UDP-glucosyltransferase 2-like [Vanessa atalanta]|uniref:UDP-glucosyltransferase 2-like n=1 Tax=Vanessa atalanta TaxID=42275 RepID=UPI001FCCDD19|nr:UDP-glucosyltransferase 2-like [Vanessa atalanta]